MFHKVPALYEGQGPNIAESLSAGYLKFLSPIFLSVQIRLIVLSRPLPWLSHHLGLV